MLSEEQISLGRQKTLLLICYSVLDWSLHLLPTQLHSRSDRRTELGKRREEKGRNGKDGEVRAEEVGIAEELLLGNACSVYY